MNKPKILFLSYHFPRPGSGLGMRTLHLLRSLSQCGNVTLVCRAHDDVDSHDLRRIQPLCSDYVLLPDKSFKWKSPVYRLLNSRNRYLKVVPLLLSREPIFTNWNTLVKNKCAPLTEYLESLDWAKYDVLHVGRLIMAGAIQGSLEYIKQCGVYTVLDLDDIESVAVARGLETGSCAPRTRVGRYLHRRDLRRLERYERDTVPLFNACIVCSGLDEEKVRKMRLSTNPWVIPNSVDTEYFEPGEAADGSAPQILFIGNMSYGANLDAVRYFVESIFPKVREKFPECTFLVVGKNASECVPNEYQGNGVRVVSNVPDTRVYYRKASLVIAPLRFGGGTRIKILEAMAMKRAVVSTNVGAEGIRAKNGEEILLAETEKEFAAQCIHLLGNPRIREKIGASARQLILNNYDVKTIDNIVRGYYLSAVQKE